MSDLVEPSLGEDGPNTRSTVSSGPQNPFLNGRAITSGPSEDCRSHVKTEPEVPYSSRARIRLVDSPPEFLALSYLT